MSLEHLTVDQGSGKPKNTAKRCWQCFRPHATCFCDEVQPIANRTSVVILQHRRERFHPFNTARIVHQWLQRCELIAGHNSELSLQFDAFPLARRVGLLFPGEDAKLLTELNPEERPDQLVIPDGTWHHVKTLMREIPRLQTLPKYRLAPTSPGRYRIRREPNRHALSTLEATVSALQSLEPETSGLTRLTDAFDRMVTSQLRAQTSNSPTPNWRRNERRRSGMPNVPRVLTGDLKNVVVAYGERELAQTDAADPQTAALYWTAVRMSDGKSFQCAIQSDSFHNENLRKHLRLPLEEINNAVSRKTFRERWRQYVSPNDRVVVFHNSTAVLLENMNAKFTTHLVLKSVDLAEARSIMNRVGDPNSLPTELRNGSRASERLANLVTLVRYLNENYEIHSERRPME
ncbi:MAG: DTW domain-containing protein [Rubripirellula sp.]|nr:DTW domain-containing protein [Rubripirellula sp.]